MVIGYVSVENDGVKSRRHGLFSCFGGALSGSHRPQVSIEPLTVFNWFQPFFTTYYVRTTRIRLFFILLVILISCPAADTYIHYQFQPPSFCSQDYDFCTYNYSYGYIVLRRGCVVGVSGFEIKFYGTHGFVNRSFLVFGTNRFRPIADWLLECNFFKLLIPAANNAVHFCLIVE
jgi:hypothetical protein